MWPSGGGAAAGAPGTALAAPQIHDLDDHTLLRCFSHLTPLPDLFNVAASCRVRRGSGRGATRDLCCCGGRRAASLPSALRSCSSAETLHPHPLPL